MVLIWFFLSLVKWMVQATCIYMLPTRLVKSTCYADIHRHTILSEKVLKNEMQLTVSCVVLENTHISFLILLASGDK